MYMFINGLLFMIFFLLKIYLKTSIDTISSLHLQLINITSIKLLSWKKKKNKNHLKF